MQINPSEISDLIRQRISQFDVSAEVRTEGTIVSVKDGILRINGIKAVMASEMIELPGGAYGIALNLEEDSVGAVVLGTYEHLSEGDTVKCTGRVLEVPVGEALLGRMVDALGRPCDGLGEIESTETAPIEKIAPGVIARQSVSEPLQTGLKAIDALVPIGRGQRELIIGDRQTGKTAIVLDTIINQKHTGVKCVYVAIGQKASSVANFKRKLEEHGALEYTTIVAATASDPAAMQYIAPYTGCTIAEYYRDKGENALIVYDDLSKHAVAYREISLLLRRPPGREAYPGDVFYLHSRLLERASRVNPDFVEKMTNGKVKGKTGSLTALPIIETQAGDVSAFVPTNVISITDGQIYLETDLFNSGIRPAMNAGLSVSRVGGAAQTKIVKKFGGGMRIAQAQYRELAAFAQFASDLDEATRKQLERGQRSTQVLKQKQYSPLSVAEIAMSLYVLDQGYLDDVPIDQVPAFEHELHVFMRDKYQVVIDQINQSPDTSEDTLNKLKEIVLDFKKRKPGRYSMAVGREIKTKIASIKNTQKITGAMEKVAVSKMRKAQATMSLTRPYAIKMVQAIKHIERSNSEYRHRYLVSNVTPKRIGYFVVTTDRGLCGGLNINLLKLLLKDMYEWRQKECEIELCTIGIKGEVFFRRFGGNVIGHARHLGDKPTIKDLIGIVKVMLDRFDAGDLDRIYIAGNEFVNTMTQRPFIEQLVPLEMPEDNSQEHVWDYIYEPDAKELLDALLLRYVETELYQAVVENLACEQSARMVAMKNATDNAGELIGELQQIYNKARQASITQEITEIVSGAEAV